MSDEPRGVQTGLGQEEVLARVVVADAASPSPDARVLRPWLWCAAVLLLAEAAVRALFGGTDALRLERFDNFPNPAALDARVSRLARDPSRYRVAVVGDSVVVGPSLVGRDNTLTRHLERSLRARMRGASVAVYDFGLAGARPADMWCLLRKLREARPDLVVVGANYALAALDEDRTHLFNPWLSRAVDRVPSPVLAVAPPRTWKERFEDRVTDAVERHWRLLGMRQALNGMIFGIQPRGGGLDTPNPMVMLTSALAARTGTRRITSWRERDWQGRKNEYGRRVTRNNAYGRMAQAMLFDPAARQARVFTYLTPQNPAFVTSPLGDAVAHAAGRRLEGTPGLAQLSAADSKRIERLAGKVRRLFRYLRGTEAEAAVARMVRLAEPRVRSAGEGPAAVRLAAAAGFRHEIGEREYRAARRNLSAFFQHTGAAHCDFSDLVPSELFYDNVHMLGEGNRMLADAIADAVASWGGVGHDNGARE